MSLGVSFETCLRRREHVLMGRRCYVLLRHRHDVPIECRGNVPLRRLGDVPPRRRLVFHFRRTCNVIAAYRATSLRCRYDVLLSGGFLWILLNLQEFSKNSILWLTKTKYYRNFYAQGDLKLFSKVGNMNNFIVSASIHKIFGTNSSFHAKKRARGKV